MPEAEQHGEVAGQVDEVPRLVWDALAQPTPRREPDDDHEHGACGCRHHPRLIGEQVDETRDDGATRSGTPGPGVGHGVNQQGQHGRDAEPAMGRQQRVLPVTPLDEARTGRQHQPAQRRQCSDQPEDLPDPGEGAHAAGQQAGQAAVLPPDAEGHHDDEPGNSQQVAGAGAGGSRASQATHGRTHGLLTPGLLDVGSLRARDAHVSMLAQRRSSPDRTGPA